MDPIWAEIDLGAIEANFRLLESKLAPQGQLLAVVKADAYGHGAVPVAKRLQIAGVKHFAVARVSEGVELREAGIEGPILVLGLVDSSELEAVVSCDLAVPVTELALAKSLAKEAGRQGKVAPVQVKVDTGMGRIGLFPKEVPAFVAELKALPELFIQGVYSHFATADCELAFAREQLSRFSALREELAPFKIPLFHIANSAALFTLPDSHFDIVRCGIALYGYLDLAEATGLRPALSWKSRLRAVRELPKGATVSYGCTYRAEGPMRVGTVAVGYGDGYSRLLSNRGEMLIGGRRVPILGRVCMDQTMVDLTQLPEAEAREGAEVVLLGRQGSEEITAEELAGLMRTISYEVLCLVGSRVKRVYL